MSIFYTTFARKNIFQNFEGNNLLASVSYAHGRPILQKYDGGGRSSTLAYRNAG